MNKKNEHISVFEHESLRIDRGSQRLSTGQLEALQSFYGEKGVSYYSLIHNGVRFNEYVGVLQIGNTIIEVLPKADKSNDTDKWRGILISMLRAVGLFDIHAPSHSDLELRSNSVLDLYFELFISEVELLLHQGLIKKYRKVEGNRVALRGSIQFSKHIKHNLVHQERFYVRHTTYDHDHDIHSILYKALKLLRHVNTNVQLNSRIGALLLNFPEVSEIKISESTFERIIFNRKTEQYRNSIEIAKLILLNYHPDVNSGVNNVLALMFDMNVLWEKFVYVSLRKHKDDVTKIAAQNTKNFWKPKTGYRSKIKPDIVLNKGTDNCIVLDTKWKNLNGKNPSPDDLRQMFVYMKYYQASKVALIYPGTVNGNQSGLYFNHMEEPSAQNLSSEECSVISVSTDSNIKSMQKGIFKQVNDWISQPPISRLP